MSERIQIQQEVLDEQHAKLAVILIAKNIVLPLQMIK